MSNSVSRCEWCEKDQLYQDYHDNEWGIPSRDDEHLFEHLILETFQAGLSWHTILKKRENFRAAFDQFDAHKISKYGEKEIDRLMQNEGIIRNRLKILAAINNAKCFLKICGSHGNFHEWIWSFTNGQTITNHFDSWSDITTTTKESDAMSTALKKAGFKFVGSTTCYAYMQAVGMVDDHINHCWRKKK
jgi:DNA-3-methyladenine glycosylase I